MDLGSDPTVQEVAAWLNKRPPGDEWEDLAPPVLMPVSAADVTPLTGRRIVVFEAGRGLWLYEQRATTEPHQYKDQTVVGVLDEADWYRARREPDCIAVPRPHPIDQLWVELPQHVGKGARQQPDQSDLPARYRTRSIVTDMSRPPVRWLRHAPNETELTGSRCWVITPRGPVQAGRVCGEPRRDLYRTTVDFTRGLDGLDHPVVGTIVPVCSEEHWYRWRQTGQRPRLVHAAPIFVWLE